MLFLAGPKAVQDPYRGLALPLALPMIYRLKQLMAWVSLS
jgi:hypothetical protein